MQSLQPSTRCTPHTSKGSKLPSPSPLPFFCLASVSERRAWQQGRPERIGLDQSGLAFSRLARPDALLQGSCQLQGLIIPPAPLCHPVRLPAHRHVTCAADKSHRACARPGSMAEQARRATRGGTASTLRSLLISGGHSEKRQTGGAKWQGQNLAILPTAPCMFCQPDMVQVTLMLVMTAEQGGQAGWASIPRQARLTGTFPVLVQICSWQETLCADYQRPTEQESSIMLHGLAKHEMHKRVWESASDDVLRIEHA